MKIEVEKQELLDVIAILMPVEWLSDPSDWCYKPVHEAMEIIRSILKNNT